MERFFELWEPWVLGREDRGRNLFTHRRREVEVVGDPDGSYTTTSTAAVVHDGTTSKIVYMGSDREAAVSAAEAGISELVSKGYTEIGRWDVGDPMYCDKDCERTRDDGGGGGIPAIVGRLTSARRLTPRTRRTGCARRPPRATEGDDWTEP
jgi:hypothetical protein